MIGRTLTQTVVAGLLVAFGVGVANAAPCSVNDVTFSSTYPADQLPADACSNALDGTGSTPDLTALAGLWGAGFVEGVTLGSAGSGSATGAEDVLGGFEFTLSGITDTQGGTYTLSIKDTNGISAPNLPFYLDFVLYLKGGSRDTAAYFFDDTLVDAEGGGVWNVTFLNNTQIPNLSNISVWVRNGDGGGGGDDEIPEPASLALVGIGLLAAGAARRRRRA